ncbi:MAG: hypothetical protein R3178_07985 [Rhodothermales bacterium]|nr:hypothetical protein [Rhodothermales bacterium]
MRHPRHFEYLLLSAVLFFCSDAAADSITLRNGRSFDPGIEMTSRAEGAPEALDILGTFRGQYDVDYQEVTTDGTGSSARCLAEVTYFNRGHGILEHLHCPADAGLGHELNTLTYLVHNPSLEKWVRGHVDSYREAIEVAAGEFVGSRLVLHDARRRRGGPVLTFIRHSYVRRTDSWMEITTEESIDGGESWQTRSARIMKRREPSATFLANASGPGSFAADLPAEARQFDFLIGRHEASNLLSLPDGESVSWKSNATAVHALNGHAVLEFNWFDSDPNLPDAATTIVRIYNRAMRRWESLFLANRNHSVLHFGGRKEDNRMVLTLFEADAAALAIPRFVFHNIGDSRYEWYSESSLDRGKTYSKNWTIKVQPLGAQQEQD